MSHKAKLQHEDTIITRMGKGFLSERVVYRGRDLHHHLKDMSWLALFAYGITGKDYTEQEIKLLNFIWVSTSYPDKAIWPNHIAALAASTGSTPSLGISIGMAVCEASIYGGTPFKVGIDFFQRAVKALEQGISLVDFVDVELQKHPVIYGYGRPLASTDERVPHVIDFAKDQELASGKHLETAILLAEHLNRSKGLNMNAAAVYCALGADLGFTAEQFHLFMTPCFIAGMPPCFIEAQENPVGTFLPIRCDRIAYSGKSKRDWN